MYTLSYGQTVMHEVHGKVEVKRITDTYSEIELSEDSPPKFESGTVDSQQVRFYSYMMGRRGTEELSQFLNNIDVEQLNSDIS